ncbi:MAG: GTP-binding DUF697 domain-containing protein [Myxococcota bacterium]|nr:GTP-binding DUF697 domain-containing protein [Myxococcota bacterium]
MAGPSDEILKTVARTLVRLEDLLDRLPLNVAKDFRSRIGTLRTVLLEKRPPALVLVGRRGAGKSSLVNALFGAKVAELGHVAAQTGRARWYDYERGGGTMSILDTRGMQEGSAPAEGDPSKTAFESVAVELRIRTPDLVLFVAKASEVDAAMEADLDALEKLYEAVRQAHRVEPPLVAIVTHCDLLEPKSVLLHRPDRGAPDDVAEKLRHVALAEHVLSRKLDSRAGLHERHVATLGVSAYMSFRTDGSLRGDERWRIEDLATTLCRLLPENGRAELARATRARAVQEELATTLTKSMAAICAAIAAAPVPIADIVLLTTLQSALVTGIAWIAGRSVDRKGTAEFLGGLGANVGMAFVLREAVRTLLKVVAPGGASVVSAAIAFSGTMAVGSAARAYYIRGVSLANARRLFRAQRGKPKKGP